MGPNYKRPNQREEETKHAAELRRLLEDFAADVPAYWRSFVASLIEPRG
jgi:hypothetical protein